MSIERRGYGRLLSCEASMGTKCCEMPKVHDDCHASVSQTASLRIPVSLLPLIPSVSNLRIAACKSSELSLESDRLKVADRTDVTKEANRGGGREDKVHKAAC